MRTIKRWNDKGEIIYKDESMNELEQRQQIDLREIELTFAGILAFIICAFVIILITICINIPK